MNIYEFATPTQLNGTQLKDELNAELVYVRDNKLVIVGDLSETQAAAGLAAHVPVVPPPPTAAEKLFAATGLTAAEYKALGL